MNKSNSSPFLDRLFARTGRWYPIVITLLIQIVTTLLFLLLATMPIQATSNLSKAQITALLIGGCLALLIRNVLLLLQTYFFNGALFSQLSDRFLKEPANPEKEARAWSQITGLGWNQAKYEFIGTCILVLLPVLAYSYYVSKLNLEQIVYIGLAITAAGLAIISFELLLADACLSPLRSALLPAQFEAQLKGLKGLHFQPKFLVTFIPLILLNLVLVGTVAYRQSSVILLSNSQSPQLLYNALVQILKAGGGGITVGILLAIGAAYSFGDSPRQIIKILEEVEKGDLTKRSKAIATDEMGKLSIYFNRMLERLENSQTGLEEQVAARTSQLKRSATQLEIAARISRDAAASQDIATLVSQTVKIISEQFGFYHTGIFLVDDSGEYLELRAASSVGGKRMLANAYRIAIGPQGIVSEAAYQKRSRIVRGISAEGEALVNPDLPMTRSEAAIPLTVQDKVIGVLDIQSAEESAFITNDIEVLQILADQIALAIQNARLISASQETVQRLETTTAENLRTTWRERIRTAKNAYRFTASGITPGTNADTTETNYLNIPITLRGQKIGTISLHRKGENPWSESDRSLAIEVSDQIALALENARLLDEAQRHAAQEQSLSDLSARLSLSLDPGVLLQTTIRELHQLPNVSEVTTYLTPPEKSSPDKTN